MSSSDPGPAMERRALSKVRWHLLVYIATGQFLNQISRVNIGYAQLTMGKDLALKAQAFGFAAGIFALSAFLMQVPAGLSFQKFGPRRWMTFIMVCWGLVTVGQAFVQNGTELAALRLLLGVFEAGALPGLILLVSIWFRDRDQGLAQSFILIGLGLSGVVGGPFSGWILDKTFFGMSGWRALFLIDGLVTVAWAFLSLLILYDRPEQTRWLKPDERAFMAKYLGDYQARKKAHGALDSSLWGALKDIRIVLLIISYFCAGWISATFAFYSPALLQAVRAGVSNQYVGLLAAGPYLVIVIFPPLWGRHADKTGERHWHCVIPQLMGAVCLLFFPLAKAPVIAMLILCVEQFANSGYNVNFWPSANTVVGKNTIAKTTALIHVGNYMGQFIAPVYFGWAKDFTGGSKLGLYSCSGIFMLSFLVMHVFFVIYKHQQKKLETVRAVI